MLKIKRILFPTDYSACAERAFAQAAYLADRYDAQLHVLHVRDADSADDIASLFELEEADVAGDLGMPLPRPEDTQARLENVEVQPEEGSVPRAILKYAADQDIDLIVMGTHGRQGVSRLLIGSVADRIVRQATCPVFTVCDRTPGRQAEAPRRILVPVDFSEHARLAVRYAVDLCRAYDARLELLHVVEEFTMPAVYGIEPTVIQVPDFEGAAREALGRLRDEIDEGVVVSTHVVIGHPYRDVVAFAEDERIDLIVIATHGLTGLKRFVLGSVAEKVIHRAPCPVFTVKGFGRRLLGEASETTPAEAPARP